MIKKRKQCEVIPYGISLCCDDDNAYINLNIKFKTPFIKIGDYYDLNTNHRFKKVKLRKQCCFYFRIRTLKFINRVDCNFIQKLKLIPIIDFIQYWKPHRG